LNHAEEEIRAMDNFEEKLKKEKEKDLKHKEELDEKRR